LFLKDAARSVVRGRGPVKRAPVVKLEGLVADGVPDRWATQSRFEFGPALPWAVFVVACWWLLRGAEVLALKLGQCAVRVGEQRLAEVRLGMTKADIEGRGKRRCFLCICVGAAGSDLTCPACSLEKLVLDGRRRCDEGAVDDFLVVGPRGGQVNHAGLAKVWREMLAGSARYGDAGDVTELEVTEHTPRRAGSQFHARRGLKLWQIQYIGRWGGSSVEKYVGEAFSDLRAGWSKGVGEAVAKGPRRDADDTQLWEIKAQLQELTPLAREVADIRSEIATFKKQAVSDKQPLTQAAAEALDFEEEAVEDKSWPVSAASVAKLLLRGRVAHAINVRTGMTHAVDLVDLSSCDPKRWSAACGWPLRLGEAWLRRGVVAGHRCSKLGCASIWSREGEVAKGFGDERGTDKETEKGDGIAGASTDNFYIKEADGIESGTEDDDLQ